MFRVKLAIVITLILTALGTAISLFFPTPADLTPFIFHLYFAMAYITTIAFIGSAIIFVMGFGEFTARLKRTYLLICIGFILIGISMLELPALLSVGLLESVARNQGYLIDLPFIASLVLLLIGTTRLGRLFHVKSIVLTWWLQMTALVVICGLMFFVPHAPTRVTEADFGISLATDMSVWVILTFNIIHTFKIKKAAGAIYTPALAWMALCFIASSLSAAGGVFARIFYGDDSTYALTAYTLIPLVPAGFLLLRSAYSFNQIAESKDVQGQFIARDFFGHPLHPKTNTNISSIDIAVYAGMLVSTPAAINNILDTVRFITAKLPPNLPPVLSPADEESLKGVYLKIEQYLLTQETIRKFTKETLRQDIAQKLNLTAATATNTFWSKLP